MAKRADIVIGIVLKTSVSPIALAQAGDDRRHRMLGCVAEVALGPRPAHAIITDIVAVMQIGWIFRFRFFLMPNITCSAAWPIVRLSDAMLYVPLTARGASIALTYPCTASSMA